MLWKTNNDDWRESSSRELALPFATNLSLEVKARYGNKVTNMVMTNFSFFIHTRLVYETNWNFGAPVRGILHTNELFYIVKANRILVFTTNGQKVSEFGSANFFHYIAYLNGKFYVTDRGGWGGGNDEVHVYDTNGNLITKWTGFNFCSGITTDGKYVYVANEATGKIKVFGENGVLKNEITTDGMCRNVRIFGSRMYVSFMNGGAYIGIKIYDISSNPVQEVGEFSHPTMWNPDIALIAYGRVYVADWGANRLYIYTTNGVLLKVISNYSGGSLQAPHSMALDEEEKVYITETASGKVKIFHFE